MTPGVWFNLRQLDAVALLAVAIPRRTHFSEVLPLTCSRPQDGDMTMTANKTVCPISRREFLANAKPLEVTVNGVALVAQAKEFSTGSFGFYLGDKVTVRIGDTLVKVQLGITATVIGSKDAPADKAVAA
jgi:hypothetical protein